MQANDLAQCLQASPGFRSLQTINRERSRYCQPKHIPNQSRRFIRHHHTYLTGSCFSQERNTTASSPIKIDVVALRQSHLPHQPPVYSLRQCQQRHPAASPSAQFCSGTSSSSLYFPSSFSSWTRSVYSLSTLLTPTSSLLPLLSLLSPQQRTIWSRFFGRVYTWTSSCNTIW